MIPAGEGGYGRQSGWQAQYHDPTTGIWFDIGDPAISQLAAQRKASRFEEEHHASRG